ncbi:hypothetical protein RQP50_02870 [Paenibacillus sp. chi10]|uniref:Uncharacterized protein n=1 Tax=Paenibacillus suaedae TaxID=3077233 RepID=A0AAJ2JT46_9BACL|nr:MULTISPECIES: hypothetical protein [unclassified Paenibacillus]MDT8975184.1 hypothetical protein [Paenibacillus sp. chi10]GAV10182.1 hypothetical protein PBN151_0087 [Paenibacillus sp. NAIST15-1]
MMNNPETSIDVILQTAADVDLETRRICLITHIKFRNISAQPVSLSHILLTLSPSRFSVVSGKIVPPQHALVFGLHKKGNQQTGWKFDRDDWFSNGRKNGEYRIEPVQPLLLPPRIWSDIRDIHIECDIDHLITPLHIHAYVCAGGKQFPAANPSSISFRAAVHP